MVIKRSVYDAEGRSLIKLVQYDRDVYIYIKDATLGQAFPVHFYNTGAQEALVVDSAVYENGILSVKIPNILLEECKTITGFVYVSIDRGERSIIRFDIDVIPRAKPGDWIEPESDDYISIVKLKQDVLDALANAVEDSVGRIGEIVDQYIDEHPVSAPVQSVNNKTGEVHLTAEDVGALPNDTVIPEAYDDTAIKDDIEEVKRALDGKANKNEIPDVPVASVNGKTGDVVLNASDVGAMPAGTVIPPEYDDTDIRNELDKKTDKVLLEYDGVHILKPDGSRLQFDELYSMLMELPDFVVLVNNNRAYHPNQVSSEQVVFVATYPSNGYIQSERITMLASGTVTTTYGVAEKTSSRVNAITDLNKNDTEKYPSVKAAREYTDAGDKYSIYYEEGDEETEYDEYVLYGEYSGAVSDLDTKIAKESNDRIAETDALKDDLTGLQTAVGAKLTEPSGAQVGQFFRVASIDADGHYVLEAVDAPSGGVTDVQIAGTSVVQDGVANIPNASNGIVGVVAARNNDATTGIKIQIDSGIPTVKVNQATESRIDSRTGVMPIVPINIDYAVKAAMCDGKGAAWTAEEQLAGRQRLGLDGMLEHLVTVDITEEQSTVLINLGFAVKNIVVFTDAQPAVNHPSQAGSLFVKVMNADNVSIIGTEAYVHYGIGGTDAIKSVANLSFFPEFMYGFTNRNTSGHIPFIYPNLVGDYVSAIRLSGNGSRYFGVGSKIVIYGIKA